MSDASPFATGGPYEEQRELFEVLSQETRHRIVQTVLGHPAHLPSLDELTYFVRKSKSATLDGLAVLADHDIVAKYEHEPSASARDLPVNFYGPTEHGVEVLAAYDYLGMVPALRAVYDATGTTEKIDRHERAPRPDLPPAVEEALAFEEPAVAPDDVGDAVDDVPAAGGGSSDADAFGDRDADARATGGTDRPAEDRGADAGGSAPEGVDGAADAGGNDRTLADLFEADVGETGESDRDGEIDEGRDGA